jgi:uncharacterized protein YbbC (DUF1343 family)
MKSKFWIYIFVICVGNTLLAKNDPKILVGADNINAYLPKIYGKKIGLLVNHTAVVNKTHLVDTLLALKVDIKKVFAPEHGFRGTADAGQTIKDSTDKKTGIPIVSLYGDNKKPKPAQIKDLDIVIFDIQDVGARFYTYISSMHYMMEACAENNVKMLILDRPNPNGHYVAGPVLDMKFTSFVGMHPIPVVHGLTVGELAKMINEEGWLKNKIKCDFEVIKCVNYSHKSIYTLPVKPSPNLPNAKAVSLYPTLCLFEGTNVSVGRGTEFPFQIVGSPFLKTFKYTFTPKSMAGAINKPLYENQLCYGIDMRNEATNGFSLKYLIELYKSTPDKTKYFNSFFTKLIGNEYVKKMIEENKTEEEIVAVWAEELDNYKVKRKKYLLYPDFE